MTLEIERKWLIDVEELPFPLERFERHRIVQSYVSFSPQIRIRSIDDERFILTVKCKAAGVESALAREEFELELSEGSYRHLLSKTEGKTLVKTRYVVPEAAIGDGVIAGSIDEGASGEDPSETMRGGGVSEASSTCGDGRVFEIDVFEGDFEGLAFAEMEFASLEEAQAYPMPGWVRADVSEDPRYRNVVMAQTGLQKD